MSGFSDKPTSELQTDASNYAAFLRNVLQQRPEIYGEIAQFAKQVLPEFLKLENRPVGDTGHWLVVTLGRVDQARQQTMSLEPGSLSDGEKCFLLAAHLVASSAVGAHRVCFWDEPDNHLSIAQVGHMITALRKSAMLPTGSQFIATSHHPETIRAFSDENTIVLQRRSHFDPPQAKHLSDIPYQGDLIDALVLDGVLE